jgi:hypothetical protein
VERDVQMRLAVVSRIGEGALPVRHSLRHAIDFSANGATLDRRAPRRRSTTQRRIFFQDQNTSPVSVTTSFLG